jgi:hypothetical protein
MIQATESIRRSVVVPVPREGNVRLDGSMVPITSPWRRTVNCAASSRV